ncbi:hypothetical protein PDJAM_G00175360 [Pangasius djambal]|uniref:Uncharacterized protein n=1 Tax=Pangasius djambal TaxID=1691987 RepID=A0ACC5ZNH8_9TELE|nr:hypothetical protein [Pangasius djambal]
MKVEQTELEQLSEQLNAATFGLEHILREMGQIYEPFISVQTHKKRSEEETLTSLPKLAAELMKSGHPLELMDGDAAHVPLIWVSAVLDELVKILGDPRVFVLSVLGIQSSGKSTMLNAMFGLQFAVSAGRCTRGAFMQLVRVSEEMKDLKFDYILIVDTEGLRALELAGKSTQHHDNELATFVVGLGNMTLINIFGENPAEMQDILQIVVQAFLRMKKVRLNPSCIFVHQNVSDITAGEKNMEGRRRLQEKLDEMAKLAAKEEESEAECFSDVIEFNVQDDVYYFAQLWEGSPPMAPPNPCYSSNVQNLKNAIFRKAQKSTGMTLPEFKSRIHDLWNALLNENFVFSFKNTLEIAVHRKLENEFGKWTWTLRSAMLDIEEKLYNRIENEKLKRIEEKDLYSSMKKTKEEVDKSMKSFFEEDKDKEILIQWRVRCENKITQLHEDLVKDTEQKLNEVLQQQQARETFERERTQNDEKLFNLSKDLALKLKSTTTNEEVLKDEFDTLWYKWVTELTQDTPPERTFDFWEDAVQILSVGNEQASVRERKDLEDHKQIDRLGDYSPYISKLKRQNVLHYVPFMNKLSFEDNDLVRTLTINVIKETEGLINKTCNKISRLGYKDSYIQEITDHVRKRVEQHHSENQRIKFKKEFTLDLCLHVCELASHRFTGRHKQFRAANDPRVYLSKQKPQYYSVFTNYCRGATTTKVFGELICSNLRKSILQAVYNKTAIGLASQITSDMPEFNGNRSNLEKHHLKCLAEEENFEKYKEYIHNPKKHFKHFITEKVNKYITENNTTVLKLFKGNLKDKMQRVINAVHPADEGVKNSRGDADMWLRSFTSSLKDELSLKEISFTDHKEITDCDFLQQCVSEGLTEMMSELDKSFNSGKDIKMEKFRKKPDEVLIEHLCQCCWVQCPFCKAICTNTMEDHDGDHSVPFHRVNGISGMYYRAPHTSGSLHITPSRPIGLIHPLSPSLSFTPGQVRKELRRIKARKAAGPDDISSRLLKSCAEELCGIMGQVFNMSLKMRVVWKTSCVVPVPKTQHAIDLSNFRLVALTSHLMKTLERLVLGHLRSEVSSAMDLLQFAYRPGIGVEDAVIFLLHRALTHLEKPGSAVRILFFDFSSAFNTIQPLLLRDLLEWTHIWRNFRHNTDSCVLLKFSGDSAILGLISDDDAEYRRLTQDFVDWCQPNHLLINVGKTKEMVVDFRRHRSAPSLVNIQGMDIERVDSYKYLGVHLNHKLDWTHNTDALYRKGQTRLYLLRRLRSFGVQGALLKTFMTLWWHQPSCMVWSVGAAASLRGRGKSWTRSSRGPALSWAVLWTQYGRLVTDGS